MTRRLGAHDDDDPTGLAKLRPYALPLLAALVLGGYWLFAPRVPEPHETSTPPNDAAQDSTQPSTRDSTHAGIPLLEEAAPSDAALDDRYVAAQVERMRATADACEASLSGLEVELIAAPGHGGRARVLASGTRERSAQEACLASALAQLRLPDPPDAGRRRLVW